MALLLLSKTIVRLWRTLSRPVVGDAGFTLAEVLIACAIISVGLVAVSASFNVGIQAVETGRQQSTAVYLAEQRMDQIKSAALRGDLPPFGYVTAALFPNEMYGAIANAAKFRRTVALTCYMYVPPPTAPPRWVATPCPAAGVPGMRVDVSVMYRPITSFGVLTTERSVQISTFLVGR